MVNIGKIRAWGIRLRDYIGWAQFFMIVYLFIKESSIYPPFIIVGLLFFSITVLYIDINRILPSESKYFANKNPWNVEAMERLKSIEGKLG